MDEPVYKVLNEIMDEKKLTIAEIARVCSLPDSTVRGIITRKQKSIALEVAFKLSKGLGVSLERLNGDEKKDPTPKREVDLRKEKLIRNYDQLNEAGKSALLDYSNYQLTKNKEDDGETLYVASRNGEWETRHLTAEEVKQVNKAVEETMKRAEKEGWGNNNDL